MIHQHNSDTGVIIKKIINMYVVEKKEDQKWDLKKPTRDPSNNKNTLTKTNYWEQNETITEEWSFWNLAGNFIRHKYVMKTILCNVAALVAADTLKSPTSTINYNCQKSSSRLRKPRTTLEIRKNATLFEGIYGPVILHAP